MIEEYDCPEQTPEEAYQNYLDQLDSPRWYLEKTYPTFYKHFKIRYDKFISEWVQALGEGKFDNGFINDLFVFYCRIITAIVENDSEYGKAINYVEANGLPLKKIGNINLNSDLFYEAVDLLFETPDMLITSFNTKKLDFQKQFQDKQRSSGLIPGNNIENRKKQPNFPKYKKVAKLIKILENSYNYVNGKQKIACEIAGCNPTSFSRWLNSKTKIDKKKLNFEKFLTLQNEITEEEKKQLKAEIDNYLKK